MIIDIHMHLGDILHREGGKTVTLDVEMPNKLNIQRFEEDVLKFNSFGVTKYFFEKFDDLYTLSVQNRIQAGNIHNLYKYFDMLTSFSKKIFGDTSVKSICMPVAPYVTWDDIYPITQTEHRLLVFASINPDLSIKGACTELSNSIDKCCGLKLHPIIQGIPFNSPYTYSALDLFNGIGKPVLLHAGASRYYLGNEKIYQHCDLDDPYAAREMIKSYPQIPFIIGHAGIAEYQMWAELLKKYDNVYYDITVQSVSSIRKLISWYGEDKMLFATDWPCVNPKTTFNIVVKALNDRQIEKCFYQNAKNLMGWN